METISSTMARKNFFELLKHIVDDNSSVTITRKAGDVVLISKSDYESMLETLYLQSIPGLVESVLSNDKNNPEDWISEDEMKKLMNGSDEDNNRKTRI